MYQAWPWGGTAAAATASPTTAAFAQPAAAGQVASATPWPAGYSQYAVTPEIQQQWAAWASHAQYAAYTGALPVGQVPTTTSYATGYAGYETAPNSSKDSTTVEKTSQSAAEKPKNPAEELVAKDTSELEKLNKLKEQAEQWKTLQQPAAAATWPYSTATTAASVNTTAVTTDPTLKPNVQSSTSVAESGTTQMDKEDEEFERQFKDWEKQFDAWKRENSNHPDKEAFARYEKQWQEWRTQLLQKKEQMQKAKASKIAAQPVTDVTVAPAVQSAVATPAIPSVVPTITGVDLNNQTNVTTVADAAAATAPNMFYPPNQFMYMQPYMYPGAVPGAQTTIPPPPFTGQSIPPANFGAPTPANQSLSNDQNASMSMNFNDPNMNMKGGQNFDQNRDGYNYSQRTNENNAEEFQNYEGYENPGMFPPEMEDFQSEMKFGRGGRGGRGARGMRGRGRARGRGGQSRWSDGPEMEQQQGGGRSGSLLPTPPGKFPASVHDGRPLLDNAPPPFEGQMPPFDDGQSPFDDGQPPFGGRQPPFDMRPPFGNRQSFDDRQPPFDGARPPFDKRPPGFEGRQPPFEGEQPPFESGQPPFDGGQPPFEGEQPPFDEGPPPYEYPPDDMGDFAPDQGPPGPFPGGDDKSAQRQNFKPDDRFLPQKGLQANSNEFNEPFAHPYDERFPPGKDRFQSENEEFPPHDERFPPENDRFQGKGSRFGPENERFPYEDERFPPGPGRFQGGPDRFPHGPPDAERFPPGPEEFPQGPMDDRFAGGRDFDQYPPDNMFGPPPFRDEFPPFDDRFTSGRGRFPGRGRRMPRGEFDRFGPPPFQPGMGEEGFGPDFPPPDRFGFPGDGPPRMPRGRGMRPNFDPGFPGRGRFPEDRFFGDGPPGRGGKTIDYTHRPASAVMGEDYNPHYDFESDFQNDVGQYRAAPSKRIKRAPNVEKKKDD